MSLTNGMTVPTGRDINVSGLRITANARAPAAFTWVRSAPQEMSVDEVRSELGLESYESTVKFEAFERWWGKHEASKWSSTMSYFTLSLPGAHGDGGSCVPL